MTLAWPVNFRLQFSNFFLPVLAVFPSLLHVIKCRVEFVQQLLVWFLRRSKLIEEGRCQARPQICVNVVPGIEPYLANFPAEGPSLRFTLGRELREFGDALLHECHEETLAAAPIAE